tara:strand:- start:194 stop:412 length:219 start_codon:yes stop_codon:yes gene_type:complete
MDKVETIDITPDAMGMWRWIETMNERSLNEKATTEAVKLWMLTHSFPFAKASDLLLIVKGDLDMEEFLKGGA